MTQKRINPYQRLANHVAEFQRENAGAVKETARRSGFKWEGAEINAVELRDFVRAANACGFTAEVVVKEKGIAVEFVRRDVVNVWNI